MPESDKTRLRGHLIASMISLSAPTDKALRAQIGETVSIVAEADFPQAWPGLFNVRCIGYFLSLYSRKIYRNWLIPSLRRPCIKLLLSWKRRTQSVDHGAQQSAVMPCILQSTLSFPHSQTPSSKYSACSQACYSKDNPDRTWMLMARYLCDCFSYTMT